jgi:gas vesicle protein
LQRERPNLPEYKVVVDDVTGGEIANIVRGKIEVSGRKIKFKGIAYGRYGGQNFSAKLSPVSKKQIKEVFGDVSKFEEDFQQKMVRGEFEIDEAAAEASRAKGDHEHHSHG